MPIAQSLAVLALAGAGFATAVALVPRPSASSDAVTTQRAAVVTPVVHRPAAIGAVPDLRVRHAKTKATVRSQPLVLTTTAPQHGVAGETYTPPASTTKQKATNTSTGGTLTDPYQYQQHQTTP